jgi:hypothetical protein
MIEDAPRIVRTPIPLSDVIAVAQQRFDPATQARIRRVVDSLIVR